MLQFFSKILEIKLAVTTLVLLVWNFQLLIRNLHTFSDADGK